MTTHTDVSFCETSSPTYCFIVPSDSRDCGRLEDSGPFEPQAQTDEDKARLVAERAKRTEQDKAAATAKVAEDARLAAEKAKQVEEAKAAAAEQRRKEIEAAVAKALADKQAAEKRGGSEGDQKVAALPSPAPSPEPAQSPQELAKSVQSELRRVGCLADAESGEWSAKSQRSLTMFNKYAGTKLNTALASSDALDAIKARSGRVCPLVCEHGFKADGDAGVKIACRAGYRVNDDNECEKVQEKKPVATRENSKPRDDERKKVEGAPAKPQATGQMVCGQGGCRAVRSGCRIAQAHWWSGNNSNTEICD
ncbi:ribosomal protein S16 [Bradyrhizobium sp. GM24.11]